jgi:hypothetical protein
VPLPPYVQIGLCACESGRAGFGCLRERPCQGVSSTARVSARAGEGPLPCSVLAHRASAAGQPWKQQAAFSAFSTAVLVGCVGDDDMPFCQRLVSLVLFSINQSVSLGGDVYCNKSRDRYDGNYYGS